ncbi:MAG: DUF896 domain-containing protein [Clostridia bacterium]|nr:DUF896 domain-containing protein [Clostridia bacterium]
MDSSKIDRINALARKAKSIGLTDEEKQEQQRLRREYIDDFRKGMEQTLENVVIVDKEGNRSKVQKKSVDSDLKGLESPRIQ